MPDPNNPDNMREIDPEKFLEENGGKNAFFKNMQPDNNFPGGFKANVDQTEQLVLRVQLLEIEIKELKHLIKLTFDGHILINGRFEKLTL